MCPVGIRRPTARVPRRLLVLLAWLLLPLPVALAQTPVPEPAPDEQKPPVWAPTATRTIRLFPGSEIYPAYLADPHQPSTGVVVGFYTRTRIPDSRSPRTALSTGGHFGVLRLASTVPTGRTWQLSIVAAFDAMFDSQYRADVMGWDGDYGLTVTTASGRSPFDFKAAILHTSSHLGDEYAERTGATRINYTREELAFGVALRLRPRLRAYGEVGAAYIMRSSGQERWRWQGGLEYQTRPTVFGGRMAWYAAADFSGMQERDWRLDNALQGGLVTRSGDQAYRVFVQWHDGRPTLGQFTTYSEASLSLGLKIEL